jgi:hypothetical protein
VRFLATIACLVIFLSSSSYAADTPITVGGSPPVPPISATPDVGNYCVYGNLLYSFGIGICVGRTGYVCTAPNVGGVDPKDVGGRGYWRSSSVKDAAFAGAPDCTKNQ